MDRVERIVRDREWRDQIRHNGSAAAGLSGDRHIARIAAKLREAAGLSKEPSGVVAQNAGDAVNGHANGAGVMDKVKEAIA